MFRSAFCHSLRQLKGLHNSLQLQLRLSTQGGWLDDFRYVFMRQSYTLQNKLLDWRINLVTCWILAATQ